MRLVSLHFTFETDKLHQTGQLSNSKLMLTRNQFAKEVAALKLILRMGLSLFAVIAAALLFSGLQVLSLGTSTQPVLSLPRVTEPLGLGLWLKGEVVDGPVTDWDFIMRSIIR